MGNDRRLPERIYLDEFGGNYKLYMDAVYAIFERDFVKSKAMFGSNKLNMKFHPKYQERAYTFYHMTHEGEDEDNRRPDLRRCECIPWTKPSIQNTEFWNLRFWHQKRKTANRICICLDNEEGVDYYVILDVRATYVLLWTAFVSTHKHEINKKDAEYLRWKEEVNGKEYTPDSLIKEIQEGINKQGPLPVP
ncbi:MAG: hypothetical protein KBF13_04560 [Prevotella sp.]|nr:hypothetical protein [Prevotella sp.]